MQSPDQQPYRELRILRKSLHHPASRYTGSCDPVKQNNTVFLEIRCDEQQSELEIVGPTSLTRADCVTNKVRLWRLRILQ